MRRVSQDLGLSPDYISSTISSGKMDIGVFYAVLERLDLDPATFAAESPDSGKPPIPTLPHTRRAVNRLLSDADGGDGEG